MNFRLVAKQLGVICILIGVTMVASLIWAFPHIGRRNNLSQNPTDIFEFGGFSALMASIVICAAVGVLFLYLGRAAGGNLYRKEAMAVVGLSWVLATFLGALPFWFYGTEREPGLPMSFVDALFESQSGFSTTGATVLSDLENSQMVPHCILFWRSSTHFLGGLGIIVLFVAILGQGSAGKALMRAEMPGPNKEGMQTRMQDTALVFAAIYCGLILLLAIILKIEGLSWFDAFCHSFGTMATGGFSTYNKSVGHFANPTIDYTIIVFMVLAGTNFTLLYALCYGKPKRLFVDIEWRTYMGMILVVTFFIVFLDLAYDDHFTTLSEAIRHGLFQVAAIITTTGYGTDDFNKWSSFGRAVLLLLMFWGGCAGSTGGGMKVIRHILFLKILRLEIEQAFHPTVVRTLRIGAEPVEGPHLRKNVLVYFGLILVIFIFSWLTLVMIEPDTTWGETKDHKLIDSASAIAATLNNIGPGLGTVGPTQNYGHFSWGSKLLFTWLMMLGRLEIFVILVLISPRFWKSF